MSIFTGIFGSVLSGIGDDQSSAANQMAQIDLGHSATQNSIGFGGMAINLPLIYHRPSPETTSLEAIRRHIRLPIRLDSGVSYELDKKFSNELKNLIMLQNAVKETI